MTTFELSGLGLELYLRDPWMDTELECWCLGRAGDHLATALIDPNTETVIVVELVTEPRMWWSLMDLDLEGAWVSETQCLISLGERSNERATNTEPTQ